MESMNDFLKRMDEKADWTIIGYDSADQFIIMNFEELFLKIFNEMVGKEIRVFLPDFFTPPYSAPDGASEYQYITFKQEMANDLREKIYDVIRKCYKVE